MSNPADDIPRVSLSTRQSIMDTLAAESISWSGRLEETDFLRRLWPLEELPSTDHRFSDAAGDIWQHRINNNDWEDDWVFSDSRFDLLHCPDELFLSFLCQTVHPRVRDDQDEVESLVRFFNDSLAPDGWELFADAALPVLTGGKRRVYGTRVRGTNSAELALHDFELLQNPGVLQDHLRRIDDGIERDPAAAIGSAKELVESVCKIILDDHQVTHGRNDDVGALYKKTATALLLKAEAVPQNVRGSEAAQLALRGLVTTVQALAELRNELGLGHGRSFASPALARHARLSATCARAVTEFLLETWHVRRAAARAGRLHS